jgi:glycerophosphoryl diester phosphodiesterase
MTRNAHAWPYPRLIAHRGAGTTAPENTLAAMRASARRGYTMVEFDVRLSRDGVAVLLHDDLVDRTSNGHGKAGDLTFAELSRLDFGGWHSSRYAGEPIPTLYAMAAFTQANGIYSNIEIKPPPGAETDTGREVAQLAARLWNDPARPPLLSSFSETALEAARQAAPDLPRALLLAGPPPEDWQARMQRLQCTAVNIDETYTTRAAIADAHAKGYKIGAWTVSEPSRARELLDWGCDAVFIDALEAIEPDF